MDAVCDIPPARPPVWSVIDCYILGLAFNRAMSAPQESPRFLRILIFFRRRSMGCHQSKLKRRDVPVAGVKVVVEEGTLQNIQTSKGSNTLTRVNQYKLEQVAEVERAFVHMDYKARSYDEHINSHLYQSYDEQLSADENESVDAGKVDQARLI